MRLPPHFCCPHHDQTVVRETEPDLPDNGELVCECSCRFPVKGRIPRVIPDQGYAASFGFEWLHYQETQLDSTTGLPLSRERLERCIGRPLHSLQGLDILEAGCGAGRFTEVLLDAGARVCALDMSRAVEANMRNHGERPGFCVVQADLSAAPFKKRAFDIVLCLGVLQHTPDPAASIRSLSRHAKAGGLVVVDNYAWSFRRVLALRYLYRAWIKRLDAERAHAVCTRLVDRWLPIHRRAAPSLLFQALLSRVSPIASYYHKLPLSEEHQRAFAYLDTFDFHTAAIEKLRTATDIDRAMKRAGMIEIAVRRAGNGIEARGEVAS